jgi:hypothetical protein
MLRRERNFTILHMFFLTLFVSRLFRSAPKGEKPEKPKPKLPPQFENVPPQQMFRFFISSLLSGINLFTLVQSIKQVRGQKRAQTNWQNHNGDLPLPDNYTPKTLFSLPFSGKWTAFNGGTTPETSHSWDILNQRYAYDFVIQDTDAKSYTEPNPQRPLRPTDFYDYAQPILAPADGEIVQVRDGIRDHQKPGTGWLDWSVRDFRGNFVVIRHAESEYSFLAHLIKGSIRVTPGQSVRRGDIIGLCGNSGHSTEPHLHFHVQNTPDFYRSVGLPVTFVNFEVENGGFNERGYIERGQRVSSSAVSRAEQGKLETSGAV